jgi:hypothetical protein
MLGMSGVLPLLPLYAFVACIGAVLPFFYLLIKAYELLMRRRGVWYIGTDIFENFGTASQFSEMPLRTTRIHGVTSDGHS